MALRSLGLDLSLRGPRSAECPVGNDWTGPTCPPLPGLLAARKPAATPGPQSQVTGAEWSCYLPLTLQTLLPRVWSRRPSHQVHVCVPRSTPLSTSAPWPRGWGGVGGRALHSGRPSRLPEGGTRLPDGTGGRGPRAEELAADGTHGRPGAGVTHKVTGTQVQGPGRWHSPVQAVDEAVHVVGQDDAVLAHVAVVPQHAHGHVGRHLWELPQDVAEGPSEHGGDPPELQPNTPDTRALACTGCEGQRGGACRTLPHQHACPALLRCHAASAPLNSLWILPVSSCS